MAVYKGRGFTQIIGRNSMATVGLGALTAAQVNSLKTINVTSAGAGYNPAQGISMNSSLSGTNNWANLTSAGTMFSFEDRTTHELLRKYEIYESTESILALSVAAHRLMRETHIYHKITDRELFNKVTHEDRTMAEQIKEYYSKKVMMWKLKGTGKLSPFRDDMNKLIHSDMLTFKENMIGIAYWLPEFYQYDVDMDLVKAVVTKDQSFEKLDKAGKPGTLKVTETLIPIKRVMRKTKRTKKFEYWFKDTQYNAGVVINLEEKNQLQHLWDTMFNKNEPITIEGQFTRRHLDDFEYYSVGHWKLAEA